MTMQLSRSAQETEEHKNKRLTAKNELMTVLRTLELEKEVSEKLRDSIKFTFTPKALSQQQLLKESLDELESELNRLSRRLGRPLLPVPDQMSLEGTSISQSDVDSAGGSNGMEEGSSPKVNSKKSRSEIDTQHLLSNLEDETQRVSQCIMALGSSIERFHQLLDESGDRSCMNVLTDIFGKPPSVDAQEENSPAAAAGRPRLALGKSRKYGQVPNAIDQE